MSDTNTPAKRNPPGRPSKFTAATRRRVIEAVAKGLPFRYACAGSGLSYASFCEYRNNHPEFQEAIETAVASAIEKRLAIIERAANLGDVGSAKWLLEHLNPSDFSRSRLEITGANGAPLAGAIAVYLPRKDGNDRSPLPAVVTDTDAN